MKKILLIALMGCPFFALAQNKIGANPAVVDSSTVLQLESPNKGFLLPRLSTTQRNAIAGPANSLLIYNVDSKTFEYNFGTPAVPKWVRLQSDSVGVANNDASWKTTGNAGLTTAANFIGNKDSVDFRIKANNVENVRISPRLGGNLIVADSAAAGYVEANLGTTNLPDAGYTRMTIARNAGQGDLGLMTSDGGVGGYPIVALSKCGGANITAPQAVSAGARLGGLEMFGHNGGGYVYSGGLRSIVDSVSGGNVFSSTYLLTLGGSLGLRPDGGVTLSAYPSSRADAAAPVNFLYTDGGGNLLSCPAGSITGSFWGTAGNTLTGAEKFGAINDVDVVFIRTNTERMRINNNGLLIGAATSSANARLALRDGHLQSQQTTAPVAAVAGALGTGGAITLISATDIAGVIRLTRGTAAWAAGTQATITFNKTYAVAPIVTITPADGPGAAALAAQQVFVTATATGFSINFNNAATAAGALNFNYHVVETQ